MENIKESSLKKALNFVMLQELPKQLRATDKGYWVESIALVRKRNMSTSYCVAKRGGDGRIRYTADFGDISPIAGLVSIHPYLVLDTETMIPYDSIEEKRAAIVDTLGRDVAPMVEAMTPEKVEETLIDIAISNVLQKREDDAQAIKMRNVVDGIMEERIEKGIVNLDDGSMGKQGVEDIPVAKAAKRKITRRKS